MRLDGLTTGAMEKVGGACGVPLASRFTPGLAAVGHAWLEMQPRGDGRVS